MFSIKGDGLVLLFSFLLFFSFFNFGMLDVPPVDEGSLKIVQSLYCYYPTIYRRVIQ